LPYPSQLVNRPCYGAKRRIAIHDVALTIIFDLDGTLIDTAPDLVETLNVILSLSPLAYDRARNLVGGGAKAMIARGLEAEGRPCPPPKLEKLFADFIAHYSEHLTERSQPFPGVDVALDALTECGYQFAVCTNKLERLSINLLERFGLAERFAAICGPDTFGIEKPDPEILRRTVAAAGGTSQRAIMIGDSIVDIRTARAAGIPVIAVDFGYSEHPVSELGPDRTISSFVQLPMSIAAVSYGL
jgi:phosphoglycolate phosphatase